MNNNIDKLFTFLFGNQIKIITATNLRAFHQFEMKFVFNPKYSDADIHKILNKQLNYYVDTIKEIRTKKIESPKYGTFNIQQKEKCIKSFDD